MQGGSQPSDKVIKVLGHALVDPKLRDALFKDVRSATTEYDLSNEECDELEKMVSKTPRDSIEALARVCRDYAILHGFCPR